MKRSKFYLFLIAATALGSNAAQAGETCYGFSGLQDDRVFNIGETFEAEHLKMHVRNYIRNGATQDPAGHFMKVQSKRIAESTAAEQSEMYIYGATMQIVPRQPVAQIRFRLSENKGNDVAGRHANLQINGKVHEVAGSLRDIDDRVFGDEANGRYRVKVSLRQHGGDKDSKWFSGTMQVRALSGQIASFGIGGTPMVVDDVCFTPNAP
mgnify:CR=1 FL=1